MLHAVVLAAAAAYSPFGAPSAARALFSAGMAGYPNFRIPAIVAHGRNVWALAEARKTVADFSGHDLVMRRSTDAGESFGALEVLARAASFHGRSDDTLLQPSGIVERESGDLLIMFSLKIAGGTEARLETDVRAMQMYLLRSSDGGASFALTNLTRYRPKGWAWFSVSPGAGNTQLASGRLVFPGYHLPVMAKPCADGGDGCANPHIRGHVMLSDDGGHSWFLGGQEADALDENQVVALRDGAPCEGTWCPGSARLMLNSRNNGNCTESVPHCRMTQLSEDGGLSWRPKAPAPALVELHPNCAGLTRWGPLVLFSNPAAEWSRLTLRASLDEAATWPFALVIDPGPASASTDDYSSLATAQAGPGAPPQLLVLFEMGNRTDVDNGTLALVRVPLLLPE